MRNYFFYPIFLLFSLILLQSCESSDDSVQTPALANEDCLEIDYENLSVSLRSDGRFIVQDGSNSILVFDIEANAHLAVDVIQFYQMTAQCFAIRPQPGLMYFKVQEDIPTGSFPGEDCIGINPDNLSIIEQSSTSYTVADGGQYHFAARSLEEAEKIIEIIRHYDARFICYVKRPNAGMKYLRK